MAAIATEVSDRFSGHQARLGSAAASPGSEALKRRIVAETLEPGSSVSIVAGCHDVNANQLFKWRREMAPEQPAGAEQGVTMLPVAIVPELSAPRGRARPSGTIEITFASGARVCVRGEVSPETLRRVIELLR